jgi:hypothetical protein
MQGRWRRLAALVCGAVLGTAVAIACVSSAAGPETTQGPARAADAGAQSTFVQRAQRGEVAPPDLDDVEHMCALLTSCDRLPIPPQLVPQDFASCVKKMSEEMTSASAVNFSLTMRECGLQASSCASLRQCALRGANPDSCNGRGKQSVVGYCDVDGRALSCWHEGILAVRDCPRGGEQCIVQEGQAKCTLGPCPDAIKEGQPPRCSASGTHILHCEKGKLASLDCAAFGLRCGTAADGSAGCTTQTAACTDGTKRCDGNVAVGCYNGHEVRIDCAAAKLACNPSAGATAVGACVAPAPGAGACDPTSAPKCDGANIKYCFAGKPRAYFCKALGFNRCDNGKNGVRCGP